MDIEARIRRRQRQDEKPRLIQDYEPLSPVSHIDEPSGRGPVFEQLLDHLGPVFDGGLPPNGYLYGPFGAGKSAVVTSLFDNMARVASESRSMIHTSTRERSPTIPHFVDVDLRQESGAFSFYHRILDALTDETIPEHGISTEKLQSRLHDRIERSESGAVVLVDHVGEPNTVPVDSVVELFAGLPSNMSWLAVGRQPPAEMPLTEYTARTIQMEAYEKQTLVDVLMTRSSAGLAGQQLTYDRARQIADWADGNAHDALTVLFIAADNAHRSEQRRISESAVAAAIAEMSDPTVSLDRVLLLSENRQAVLRKLVDMAPADRDSVKKTTELISGDPNINLSQGTVKRFLYELAEYGILARVETGEQDTKGRPPSRVEIQFPPTAFRRLHDLQS